MYEDFEFRVGDLDGTTGEDDNVGNGWVCKGLMKDFSADKT